MGAAKAIFNVTITTSQGVVEKTLEGEALSIGRAPDCSICIRNDNVSRKHLTFVSRDNQVWMEDHESANGTFLNGSKIKPHTLICVAATDKIRLGSSDIQLNVEVEGPPPPEPEKFEKSHGVNEATRGAVSQVEIPQLDPARADTIIMMPNHLAALRKLQERTPEPPPAQARIPGMPSMPAMPSMPPAPSVPGIPEIKTDSILKEAQKKATQIIFDAESAAEKRVQEIYERAHETQKKADSFYRQRLTEAYEESQKYLQEAQEQGREFLSEARRKAQEIRDQVEAYSSHLRSRSENECATMLSEAEARGRELKEQRIHEADSRISEKEAELLAAVRKETEDERNRKLLDLDQYIQDTKQSHEETIAQEKRLHAETISREKNLHEETISKEKLAHEELIAKEKKTHEENIAQETHAHLEQLASLKIQIEEMTLQRKRSEEDAHQLLDDLQKKIKSVEDEIDNKLLYQAQQKSEFETVQADLKINQEIVAQLLQESKKLEEKAVADRKQEISLQQQIQKSREDLGHLSSEIQSFTEKLETGKKEYNAEIIRMKEKFEQDRHKLDKQEEEKTQQLRLEATQQVRKLERELLEELHTKKDRLSREILLSIESNLKGHLPKEGWTETSLTMQEQISSILSGQIVTISKDSALGDKKKQLISERKKERWFYSFVGILCGALVLFVVQTVLPHLRSNNSPLQQMATEQAQLQKKDLEDRRFNPPQVPDLKDNYTDAVIYTKDFASLYLEPAYQKKWSAAAVAYLLRTWHLDEDHSIQALSTSSALVKNLFDRRQKIHPDFVNEAVSKMRETEKESVSRMRETLGSQVRYESFKKFERDFFEQEVLQRGSFRN